MPTLHGLAATAAALVLATAVTKADNSCKDARHKFTGPRLHAPVRADGSVKWEIRTFRTEWTVTCNKVELDYVATYGHADLQLIGPGDKHCIPAKCSEWTQAYIDEIFPPKDYGFVLGDFGFLTFKQDGFEVALPAYTDRAYNASIFACNAATVWRPQVVLPTTKWQNCSTAPYVE